MAQQRKTAAWRKCFFKEWINVSERSFNYYFNLHIGYFVKADSFWPGAKLTDIWRDKKQKLHPHSLSDSPCQRLCPAACDFITYEWSISVIQEDNFNHNYEYIILSHRFDSDILYTHWPAVDFFEFIACVGGLAGMWIGISFLSLWQQVSISFSRMLTRFLADSIFSRQLNKIKQKIAKLKEKRIKTQNSRRTKNLFN